MKVSNMAATWLFLGAQCVALMIQLSCEDPESAMARYSLGANLLFGGLACFIANTI
jgi:hypothetical protein